MTVLEYLGTIAKAIVAFVAPGAVIITSAVLENSAGGENITSGEWWTAACATVITAAAVYGVPNKAPVAARDGRHEGVAGP